MYLGLLILLISVIILGTHIPHSGLPTFLKYEFLAVTLSFGGIMFASSYVEEEQQFWYWIATTHFAIGFLQRYIHLSLSNKSPKQTILKNKIEHCPPPTSASSDYP
jgi:GPI ethanolamine phosphate transferase membrane region